MKNRLVCALLILISVGLFAGCSYACLLEYGGGEWQSWLSTFAAILFIPFAAAFHETGHMLFGAASKIKAAPRFGLFRTSSCKLIPKTDHNLRTRLIVTALGGIAVNFLFLVLGVVALFVPAVPVGISEVLPASFYFFALNGLPLRLGDGKTDGLVVWELLKNDDEAKVALAVLNVQAQVVNGKPIGEVDEKFLFDLPVIREDDESFIALTELRYEFCKAKGETERAEAYRARFEELKEEYLDES